MREKITEKVVTRIPFIKNDFSVSQNSKRPFFKIVLVALLRIIKWGVKHSPIITYFLAEIIVSATFCGTISYLKNSMVKLARPSVIERRPVM